MTDPITNVPSDIFNDNFVNLLNQEYEREQEEAAKKLNATNERSSQPPSSRPPSSQPPSPRPTSSPITIKVPQIPRKIKILTIISSICIIVLSILFVFDRTWITKLNNPGIQGIVTQNASLNQLSKLNCTNTEFPKPTNMAELAFGSRILTQYTTDPPNKWLWYLSSKYEINANCMLRPKSLTCWPIKQRSSVGVELGTTVNISSIKLKFSVNQAVPSWVKIYNLDDTDELSLVRETRTGAVEFEEPLKASKLVFSLVGPDGMCLQKMYMMGYPN